MASIGSIIGVVLVGGLLASACIVAPQDASEGPVESAQAADVAASPEDATTPCGVNEARCLSSQKCCVNPADGEGDCIPQSSKCPNY
jgi:hypothetical protein